MRRILIILTSLTIIFSLIFFAIKDRLNISKILKKIENDIGISIKLKDNQEWSYYPKISYQNDLSLYDNDDNLVIKNSHINITRSYGISSPLIIKYQSPSIVYKGVNFRDSKIESKYNNKIINLNKFTANIVDGNMNIDGYFSLDNNKKTYLNGTFNNIAINRILKQLKITNWERVKIKLSSSHFSLYSINATPKKIIENLNGEMDISGSIFFVSREEERFGATFLSLLVSKFTNMKSLSKSLNYLLNEFADIPSQISGKLNFNEGVLKTEKLLIENKNEKAYLDASLDLKSNKVNGKMDFYKDDNIFLIIEILGDLKNPEIFIDGENFTEKGTTERLNIKEIFEKGIQSIVDDILNPND